MKKIKTATIILSVFAAISINQYQAQANSFLQQLWNNAWQGAAQEVGSRLMGGFLDSFSSSTTSWKPGVLHPRYPINNKELSGNFSKLFY